jgi:hypothetical protein
MLGSRPDANRVILGKSRVITEGKFPRKFFSAKYRVEKEFCCTGYSISSEELLATGEQKSCVWEKVRKL